MPLLKLPLELLVIISSYHTKADIKSVRLVCKTLQSAASQFLFERLYLSPQTYHLDIFRAVSQHPIFSKYIKEIVYDASYFDPDIDSLIKYKRKLRLQLGGSEDAIWAQLPDKATMMAGFINYQRRMKDQEMLMQSGADLSLLRSSLPLLPKVDEITILDQWIATDTLWGAHYSIPLARLWPSQFLQPVSYCDFHKLCRNGVSGTERSARFKRRGLCLVMLAQAIEGAPSFQLWNIAAGHRCTVTGHERYDVPLGLFSYLNPTAIKRVSAAFNSAVCLDLKLDSKWISNALMTGIPQSPSLLRAS